MPGLPGLIFLLKYPPHELWRLYVDGKDWRDQNGWEGYESREKGSINAALESLCSTALFLNKMESFELSVPLIQEINEKCGTNVALLKEKNLGEIREDNNTVFFGIPGIHASIKGIEEFLRLPFLKEGGAMFGPGNLMLLFFGSIVNFEKNHLNPLNPIEIPRLAKEIYENMAKDGLKTISHYYLSVKKNTPLFLEAITQSYNKEIKVAKTIDKKLYVIAKHIRQYEVLHPFLDANGRTFANNLLNILLMQHGLPPATFYDPNVFDLYSTDELVAAIKEAIYATLKIIKQDQSITLYGYQATKDNEAKFLKNLNSPSYNALQTMDFPEVNFQQLKTKTKNLLASLHEQYPLHTAIYFNARKKISRAIESYHDVINHCPKPGAPPCYVHKTPIHLALMSNNYRLAKRLIANNADLSLTDLDNQNAYHYAVHYGNSTVFQKVTLIMDKKKMENKARFAAEMLDYFVEKKDEYLLLHLLENNKDLYLDKRGFLTAIKIESKQQSANRSNYRYS
jgi:hypothetical protein